MGLADELRELGSTSLDDKWSRPISAWSSRTTDIGRSIGSSASSALSGAQSLKSYLSQIKEGLNSREFQSDAPNAEDMPASPSDICQSRTNDKYERVKKLESSLYGIQSNVELKRSNILEELYQKINNLETRISDGESEQRKLYLESNKTLETIERSISTAKTKHDLEVKDAIAKMEEVYQRFNDTLQKEKEQWKKNEKATTEDVNEQIKIIRDELEEMKKAKTHVATYLKKYIEAELPQLKKRISTATDEIRNMEKNIVASTNEDLVTLANFIKQEASQLNELKRTVLQEVSKSAEITKTQLAKETEERKHMQQRMVALMEETLKRLGSPI